MAVRQTRIYAPHLSPYNDNNWAETMMARVIRPMVQGGELNWFWFTRYASEKPEFADSDGTNVPSGFFGNQLCRSLRFRFDIDEMKLGEFESRSAKIVEEEGCWLADWRDYRIDELCNNRFIGEDRSEDRRKERLSIVRDYTYSVSRLALHALVPDIDGKYRFEVNDDNENPHGSAFFSLHHLFCNTTDVLLTALLAHDATGISGGTRQYPPDLLQANPNAELFEFRVRF